MERKKSGWGQSVGHYVRSKPRLKNLLLPVFKRVVAGRGWLSSFLQSNGFGDTAPTYENWLKGHGSLTQQDRLLILDQIRSMQDRPLISVLIPAYNTETSHLQAAIKSVQAQIWPDWELCIVDDGSTDDRIGEVLMRWGGGDSRIHPTRSEQNGHISAASNTALSMARGEWVVLMDHDDLLAPHALYCMASAIIQNPSAQIIFSDEDRLCPLGKRTNPYFKPQLDPDLLLCQNMVSHLGAYRTDLLRKIGGFRIGFEGSQDHDLALRCLAEVGEESFVHIPEILYHWREPAAAKTFSQSAMQRCVDASRRAVSEHLAARGIRAEVTPSPALPQYHRIRREFPAETPVSVIIPTRDRPALLRVALDGLLRRTDIEKLEVLVVDNGSVEAGTKSHFQEIQQDSRVRVLAAPGSFNYSRLNNLAAGQAQGDILVLLNDDTEITDPDWLRELASHALRPEIGAVGARLLYPDGTVQHGGVVLGFGGDPGVAGHFGLKCRGDDVGPFGWLVLTRSVSAVTGACLVVERAKFLGVGGLDEENLAVAFNDVDFCLRLQERGARNLYVGHVTLVHHESQSRGREDTPDKVARFMREEAYMHRRWGHLLARDPWWNSNLDLRSGRWVPAARPRHPRPWQVSPAPQPLAQAAGARSAP